MKSFSDYLREVNGLFSYRVKIAGEFSKENLEKFKEILAEFDLVECSDIRGTPIMASLEGFPNAKNQPLNMFEFTIKYPASIPQLYELVARMGCDENNLQIMNKNYAESMDFVNDMVDKDMATTPRLENDYPEDTQEHKDLSKAYSESFLGMLKDIQTFKHEFAK